MIRASLAADRQDIWLRVSVVQPTAVRQVANIAVYLSYLTNLSPVRKRHGIALALSGGGYRAMLFYVGAIVRLNEMRLLKDIRRISSISGGSHRGPSWDEV